MDFTAFDLRIGTVVEARLHDGALALVVDLGGVQKRAVARITEGYSPDSIRGRQVVAVTNAAGATASEEIVVLAAVSPAEGAVLLQPERPVPNGTQVV